MHPRFRQISTPWGAAYVDLSAVLAIGPSRHLEGQVNTDELLPENRVGRIRYVSLVGSTGLYVMDTPENLEKLWSAPAYADHPLMVVEHTPRPKEWKDSGL